jgi:hypothetical protein
MSFRDRFRGKNVLCHLRIPHVGCYRAWAL